MDIIISGFKGQMGQTLNTIIMDSEDMNIVGRIGRSGGETRDGDTIYKNINDFKGNADVIIDFSTPSSIDSLLEYVENNDTALVLGTTGFKDPDLNKIKEASKNAKIFHSSNMSLGINLLLDLVTRASKVLPDFDIEIVEKHHNQKIDSPSGTAYMIADKINDVFDNDRVYTFGRNSSSQKRSKKEIGIHAIRGGTIVGEHTTIFAGNDEVLEIKHNAESKNVFAEGAIAASKFIIKKENGLYNMDDLINS